LNNINDKLFLKLLKTYTYAFVLIFVGYTLINWFLTAKFRFLEINTVYIVVFVPLLVCLIFTYFVFRPLIYKLKFNQKAAEFSLWILLPFSIGISIAFSQSFFIDKSYSVIAIDKPSDIVKYPKERFYKIKKYLILPERYFIIREQYTLGKNGTTLVVPNYFTTAIYDDSTQTDSLSKVAYGTLFSTSIHNGVFDKDLQTPIIKKFNIQSDIDYSNYNFYNVDLFERVFNSDDAVNFNESWMNNSSYDKRIKPIVITKMNRTLDELNQNNWNMFVYTTVISYFTSIIFLFLFNLFKRRKTK
jgi:hypothetical protein